MQAAEARESDIVTMSVSYALCSVVVRLRLRRGREWIEELRKHRGYITEPRRRDPRYL